ncbi:MAG: YobA family protein [Hymenobacteraceae bacterium]|nr:YobA family protein [Hymenobacteraceae bacterium]
MKKSLPHLILFSSLAALLLSCRGGEPKRMPDTLPDVRGYITDIRKTANNGSRQVKGIVMVRAMEGLDVQYPDASIRVDENTLIEDADGERFELERLREGHEVEAWFEGDVMESMPVQGYAKAIRVRE